MVDLWPTSCGSPTAVRASVRPLSRLNRCPWLVLLADYYASQSLHMARLGSAFDEAGNQ